MKIIIPCGGRSSRYPNMPPKWMLPDHDGVPMVVRAVQGLDTPPDDIIVTVMREHDDKFDACAGIRKAFGRSIEIVVLDEQTQSQSETVALTLRETGLDEPFLVKDSDNHFTLDRPGATYNYVSVASLNDFDQINPRNKSYCRVDQEDIILAIREKRVISDLFSVGGYFFTDPGKFLDTFDELSQAPTVTAGELYISEIIANMALRGEIFKVRRVQNYEDWGTVHEWREKLQERRLFFVAVDGFLFERGSAHFSPAFENAEPNERAVAAVRQLGEAGHAIMYLSIRPAELQEATASAIARLDLPAGNLIMECGVAQWNLVTAPDATLPFSTSRSLELSPDDPNLREKLDGHN